MNLLRLAYIAIFTLTFSGRPVPTGSAFVEETRLVKDKGIRLEDNESIPWIPERRLTWDDFLCAPERNTDAVASTSTSLGIAYKYDKGSWSYSITCNFSKHKSWGLLKTDYILAHEQGHFDITEIYARKLHKALTEYKFNARTFKKDISNIYQGIVKEKEAMQEEYDGETDHSRRKRIQMEWLDRIQEMLTETAPYADYP